MEEYKSVADKQSNKVRKKHSFKATMFLSPSSKVQTNIYKHFFVVSLKKNAKKETSKALRPQALWFGLSTTLYLWLQIFQAEATHLMTTMCGIINKIRNYH